MGITKFDIGSRLHSYRSLQTGEMTQSLNRTVPFQEQLSPTLVQGPQWLAQVSERRRVVEIQFARRVVCEYPRKHRVLGNIVVGAPSNHVERHDVLKVRDLSSTPQLRESAGLQHLEK